MKRNNRVQVKLLTLDKNTWKHNYVLIICIKNR